MFDWIKKLWRRPYEVSADGQTLTRLRPEKGHALSDVSTRNFPWFHPEGFPYQIYEGPTNGPMQKWAKTSAQRDGLRFVQDDYSDRLYFVEK